MLGVGRARELSVKLVGPGVVRTHDPRRLAFTRQEFMRAMFADIVESAQDALPVPDNGDRLACDLDGHEGARLAQLFGMAYPLPCLGDDLLQVDLMPSRIDIRLGAERKRSARIRVVAARDGRK